VIFIAKKVAAVEHCLQGMGNRRKLCSVFVGQSKGFREAAPTGAIRSIVSGGITVGILDTFLAMSLFHAGPIPIYQSIASGLLGRAAYEGGLATAALGFGLHFFIATTAAAVYWVAANHIPLLGGFLRRRWVLSGVTYGVAVYYFMQMVAHLSRLPVSGAPKPMWRVVGSILGHALLVGLPIAWFTQRNSPVERAVTSVPQETTAIPASPKSL
jgi:hypothetical protein